MDPVYLLIVGHDTRNCTLSLGIVIFVLQVKSKGGLGRAWYGPFARNY